PGASSTGSASTAWAVASSSVASSSLRWLFIAANTRHQRRSGWPRAVRLLVDDRSHWSSHRIWLHLDVDCYRRGAVRPAKAQSVTKDLPRTNAVAQLRSELEPP